MEEITANEIDGEMFIELNDEYLREIAPKLCERMKMKKAVNIALSLTSLVSKAIFMLINHDQNRLCSTVMS